MSEKREALLTWWQRRHENGVSDYVYYGTVMVIAIGLAMLLILSKDMPVLQAMAVIGKFAIAASMLARMFRENWGRTLVLLVGTMLAAVLIVVLIVSFAPRPRTAATPPLAVSLLHLDTEGPELADYRLGARLDVPECPSTSGALQRSYSGPDGPACFRHLSSERIATPLGADENVAVDRLDLARFGVINPVQPVCVALRDGHIVGVAVHVAKYRRRDVERSIQNTLQQPPDHVRWYSDPGSDSYYERDLWSSPQVRSAVYTRTVPPHGRAPGYDYSTLVMESPEGPRPFAATRMALDDCPRIALDYPADAR
ncbi:hypothetical protein ACPWR0_00810 [Pandoraea pneumonica]|uniref:hypothetical protein n=1 Tax=Pandoraea pneumonica TaxID=2508299 RepID=UPI003CED17FA